MQSVLQIEFIITVLSTLQLLPSRLQANQNKPALYSPLATTLPYSPLLSPTLPYSPLLSPTLPYSPLLSPTLPYSPLLSPTLPYSPFPRVPTCHSMPCRAVPFSRKSQIAILFYATCTVHSSRPAACHACLAWKVRRKQSSSSSRMPWMPTTSYYELDTPSIHQPCSSLITVVFRCLRGHRTGEVSDWPPGRLEKHNLPLLSGTCS